MPEDFVTLSSSYLFNPVILTGESKQNKNGTQKIFTPMEFYWFCSLLSKVQKKIFFKKRSKQPITPQDYAISYKSVGEFFSELKIAHLKSGPYAEALKVFTRKAACFLHVIETQENDEQIFLASPSLYKAALIRTKNRNSISFCFNKEFVDKQNQGMFNRIPLKLLLETKNGVDLTLIFLLQNWKSMILLQGGYKRELKLLFQELGYKESLALFRKREKLKEAFSRVYEQGAINPCIELLVSKDHAYFYPKYSCGYNHVTTGNNEWGKYGVL